MRIFSELVNRRLTVELLVFFRKRALALIVVEQPPSILVLRANTRESEWSLYYIEWFLCVRRNNMALREEMI